MLTLIVVLAAWVALYFLVFAISRHYTCAPFMVFMFVSALCFWSTAGLALHLYPRFTLLRKRGKKRA